MFFFCSAFPSIVARHDESCLNPLVALVGLFTIAIRYECYDMRQTSRIPEDIMIDRFVIIFFVYILVAWININLLWKLLQLRSLRIEDLEMGFTEVV